MKLRLFLLLSILSFSTCLLANEIEKDEAIWLYAYCGDFCNVHRMILSSHTKNIKDDLINHFAVAYVAYRMGNKEEIEATFKGVDSYLEYHYINKEE